MSDTGQGEPLSRTKIGKSESMFSASAYDFMHTNTIPFSSVFLRYHPGGRL